MFTAKLARDKLGNMPGLKSLQKDQAGNGMYRWPQIPGSQDPNRTMSGPLMTAFISMFGERSLLAFANSSTNDTDAAKQICTTGRMPFFTFQGFSIYENNCGSLTGSNDHDEDVLAAIMLRFMTETFRSNNAKTHLSAAL
jgi:hypothetical protein